MIVVPSGDPSVLCVSMAVQPRGDSLVFAAGFASQVRDRR